MIYPPNVTTSTTAEKPTVSKSFVMCQGQPVEAHPDRLQQHMTDMGVPLFKQRELWLDFVCQNSSPDFADACLARVERLDALLARFAALSAAPPVFQPAVPSASAPKARRNAPSDVADTCFVWLGSYDTDAVEILRGVIRSLAGLSLIPRDADQQAALRRGLGCAVTAAERSSPVPRVRWLGPVDMLHCFVSSLFSQGLITCPGGDACKWTTLLALFVRPDGSLFRPSIRSSRCSNPDKLAQMAHLLAPLALARGKKKNIAPATQ